MSNYEHTQEAARDAKEMERFSILRECNAPSLGSIWRRQERELAATCKTCKGTGSKHGQYLDCPDCNAALIIAMYERRKSTEAK